MRRENKQGKTQTHRLVPRQEVLMAKIQRPLAVPMQAEMNRLDPLSSRATVVGVVLEQQPRAPEPVLRHEDALVADGHLEGLVLVGVVEARRRQPRRELDDLAPLEVLPLDVVRVEERGRVAVEVGQLRRGGDPPVEDDGALHLAGRRRRDRRGARLALRRRRHGGEACREQAEQGRGVHGEVYFVVVVVTRARRAWLGPSTSEQRMINQESSTL